MGSGTEEELDYQPDGYTDLDDIVEADDTEEPEQSEEIAPEQSKDIAPEESEDIAPEESEDIAPEESEDVAPEQSEDIAPEQSEDIAPEQSEDIAPEQSKDKIRPQDLHIEVSEGSEASPVDSLSAEDIAIRSDLAEDHNPDNTLSGPTLSSTEDHSVSLQDPGR